MIIRQIYYIMKSVLLLSFSLFSFSVVAQELTEPLVIPNLYIFKITPNGKWLAGGSSEASEVYNMKEGTIKTYDRARYGTITNNGILATNSGGKPALLINGEAVVPESLAGARSGSIQLISDMGTRLCGNINYPEIGVNGLFTAEMDEDGNVGTPRQLPRPSLDFFGCQPQFVNIWKISADGSTIVGFVQDWRGYYCYPIVYRENENGDWEYSFPTESLFNPNNCTIPENPWLDEPKFPNFTDFMTPLGKSAYEEALSNYYMGVTDVFPDAKDYMTEEQWNDYYEAAVSYNEWFYGQEERINSYNLEYNKIIYSSVIFELNSVAISPDGEYIGCSYYEMEGADEKLGIMRINTVAPEFQKYETTVYDLFPTQILSNGTMLMSQPINAIPNTYVILPDQDEITAIKDYFKDSHPDYLEWMNEYLENTGSIYVNDDMTIFAGSILPGDCERVEDITGGYYSFTYVFSPDVADVETIQAYPADRYSVFSINGYKVLETTDSEDLKKLPKGIYIVNGKTVKMN